ncbi:hypothetical protein D9M69_717390 [compost metagenome]
MSIANQNSNSPYFATLKRLVIVRSTVTARAKDQVSTCGNQLFSTTPAAIASMGITSTQNHQYSQPIVKPAHRPIARSA